MRVGAGYTPATELGRATAPVFLDFYSTAPGGNSRTPPTTSVSLPASGADACTLPSDPYSALGGPFAYAFDLEGRATLTGDALAALLPCYAAGAGASVGAGSPRAVASLRTDGVLRVTPLVVANASTGLAAPRGLAAVFAATAAHTAALYVGGSSVGGGSALRYAAPARAAGEPRMAGSLGAATSTSAGGGGLVVGSSDVRALGLGVGGRLVVADSSPLNRVSRLYACGGNGSVGGLLFPGTPAGSCMRLSGTEAAADPLTAAAEPAGVFGFVFESPAVLWTLVVGFEDGRVGRTPRSTLLRYVPQLRDASSGAAAVPPGSAWARGTPARDWDVTPATRAPASSGESLAWPVYSIAGRAEAALGGRFVLYGVSRKALFRVDPYAPPGTPAGPVVVAYARPGTAFRGVLLPPWVPVTPTATPSPPPSRTRSPKAKLAAADGEPSRPPAAATATAAGSGGGSSRRPRRV